MADRDLILVVNRMQAIHASVPGVRYAPRLQDYPTALATAHVPAVLTWPVGGSWYAKGGGWRTDERSMLVLLFWSPLGQNDIPAHAHGALDLLCRLRARYIESSTIPLADPGDNDGGFQATIESSPERGHQDGGIEPTLQFGGAPYYGARLTVTVRVLWL